MPIIPIIAAGAAWGLGGGAAIGAVFAGTATLATTLTAVATVGATLGAIGAVTHDKTLSTVGTIMGAVGGIGALAANAGLFGSAATTESLFGAAESAGVVAPDIAADVAATNDLSNLGTLPELPGMAQTGATAAGDAVSATGEFAADSILPGAAINSGTAAASGEATGLINSGSTGGLKSLVSDNVDPATNQLVKGAGGGSLPSGSPTDAASIAKAGVAAPGVEAPTAPMVGGAMPDVKIPGTTYQGADGVTYVSDGTKWAAQGGIWSNLMKSPMTQYGMLQAGGSLIQGMFDPLKPAQVDALDSQARANRAGAGIQEKQIANMNGPLPVATRTPVAPRGLINMPGAA